MTFDWHSWTHWKWSTLFRVATTDGMILAHGTVSFISTVTILVILSWTVLSFRRDNTLTATKPMRYTCIMSMILFLIQSFLELTTTYNGFINISILSCKIFYSLQLLIYNFAKISMFWLFSYRLQLICSSNSKLKISPILLYFYRISCFVVPTFVWIAWIYLTFPDTKPHDTNTPNNRYKYCYPQRFPDSFIAENIVGAGVVFVDVIFTLSALFAFIIKCYQCSILINHDATNDIYSVSNKSNKHKSDNMRKIGIAIKKSTYLAAIALISTMCYTIGGAYILKQISYFLCFDGVISSLSMLCLFRGGEDVYNSICLRMEYFLYCICCSLCREYNDYTTYQHHHYLHEKLMDEYKRSLVENTEHRELPL